MEVPMKIRLLLTLAPVLLAAPAPQQRARTFEGDHWIFFAVLEGLFTDGVPDEIVVKILEPEEKGGRYANFVYACGICNPSLEAFRAYLARHKYAYARKGDMVGEPNLPAEVTSLLSDAAPEARRAGLHLLIQRYVQRRVDLLRLTEQERIGLMRDFTERRKQGMEMLRSAKLPWRECPSCEGTYDVFKK
jgi:hypothetical protein